MEHTQQRDTSQLADVDHQIAKTPGVAVVGIGASAGGLDAISQFFAALPADTGLAFVFVQHLDPTRDSQLSEILRKISPIPVTEVCDEVVVEANHFYVIPSNKELTVKEGVLRLRPRAEAPTPWFPINAFMASLAEAYGSRAIAVVLSGTGADGAEGLKAVKAACGITFAQSEGTARFSGMPLSAIGTGAVDFVLSPQEIAAELARIGRDPAALRESADFPVAGKDDVLRKILALLRSASQVDFVNYKQSTVRRRIGRRMVVHKLEDPAAYLEYMERHPGEVMELFRDILIHVTSFFREPESFEALMEHVQVYAEKLRPDEIFRVWVAGCATGEEVYSLAICLDEVLRVGGRRVQIQLFGTDISELSLQKARRAIYPDAIAADVPPVRLSRYFVKLDEGYQVVKSIREACVFARHDLTIDPPFSRLDLISCRNVLIYMGAPLQQKVFSLFHYGLKRGGTLMLGSAEAVPATLDYFLPLNREHKIFRKNATPSLVPAVRIPSTLPSHETEPVTAGLDLQSLVQKAIHNKFAVDGALVRRDMQIVLFLGHMGQYLDPAPGTANLNLVRMVREELAFKIQGLVLSAIEKNAPIREEGLILSRGEESRRVDVEIIPLPTNVPGELYLLVLFEGAGTTAAITGEGSVPVSQEVAANSGQLQQRLHELERDLQQARAHLRSIAEEHEASVEELRASNEEVRSSNEELQSTNEELGTTKEELQSVNEELTTLNEELKTKNAELGSTNDDLKNLFSAANLPVVMVGNDLRIRRFTPGAEALLNLIPADIGRLVNDLRGTIEVPHLVEMLRKAIDDLVVSNMEIQAANKRWHSVSCRPYRTLDNRIEGAVITFVDIDNLKQSLRAAEMAREYAEGIVDTMWEPLMVLDRDLRVQRAAPSFYRAFQVAPSETEGKLIYELGNGQWNIPRLRMLLQDVLPRNSSFQDFEVEQTFPQIGFRSMRLNARRIHGGHESGELILLAIEDVTHRREVAEIRYRRLFETAKDGILILDVDSGEVIDVNPHFLQLSMCPRTDLIGRKLWETGLFEVNERLRAMIENVLREDTIRLDDIHMRARDGKKFELEVMANRYTVAGQNVIQCNFRDITERKRIEHDLRRSNDELQQFAYAASHDLQEPLRTVRNYSQIFATKYESIVDDDGRKFLSYMQAASGHMTELIKDLLTYSQISSAGVKPEPVQAERILAWTVMNLQMAISDSNAIVTNDPLPTVRVDQMHFVQIFQNLIGNALKYRNPAVPPHIHVSAQQDGVNWIFSVRDNGIGFEQRHAERIFGVFKRLHGKDYPGTGIGLSICKKIVERHGGNIWATSVPGEGSTFYFAIPDAGQNGPVG